LGQATFDDLLHQRRNRYLVHIGKHPSIA
jgi:hypothetical protein